MYTQGGHLCVHHEGNTHGLIRVPTNDQGDTGPFVIMRGTLMASTNSKYLNFTRHHNIILWDIKNVGRLYDEIYALCRRRPSLGLYMFMLC